MIVHAVLKNAADVIIVFLISVHTKTLAIVIMRILIKYSKIMEINCNNIDFLFVVFMRDFGRGG